MFVYAHINMVHKMEHNKLQSK